MSFWKSYTSLSSKTRMGFGVAVIAWGAIGLWASDKAEEKKPATEADKAALAKYTPSIRAVDREEKR